MVRGDPADGDAAAVDLPAALGRLGRDYHYILVVVPPGHPALTPQLLAYATRVLVVGSLRAIPALRAALAALPLPPGDMRPELGVLLTEAPASVRPNVATLDLFTQELGVEVRGILPAMEDAQGLPAAVTTIGRWLVGQRIGLVLGAGGAKGFAHFGVIRALRRARVPIDCVTGTSIGAIMGAGVAMEAPLEDFEVAMQGVLDKVFRPTVPVYGMSSNRAVAAWFRDERVYGDRVIEELPIPLALSATDLNEGSEIVLRRGPLWLAVLASMAIPGIYPPVRVGRHWLVDGGVVNPVPVDTAQLLGADVVIAVDLSEPLAARHEAELAGTAPPRPPTLPNTILRARDIMMSEIQAHTAGSPAVLIKPRISGVSLREFGRGIQFVDAGEAAAEEVLPRLREQLPWLGE